jgi:RNA polymerase sigma factor (sigma-70 family)
MTMTSLGKPVVLINNGAGRGLFSWSDQIRINENNLRASTSLLMGDGCPLSIEMIRCRTRMPRNLDKEELFRELINRFAQFIRARVHKYQLARFGLDADDIAQDVSLKIWKVVQDQRPIHNYASYIKKIIDSSVIDQLRKCKREEGLVLLEKTNIVSEVQSGYWARCQDDRLLHLAVGKAIDALLDSRRKAVKLYLLNMSIEEIAVFYGWSQDKARNLLYRGLSDLKRGLMKREETHGDG